MTGYVMDEIDIEYCYEYENYSGQHTNGPAFTQLRATHKPTGISVFLPWTKYQSAQRKIAREMIEWSLSEWR